MDAALTHSSSPAPGSVGDTHYTPPNVWELGKATAVTVLPGTYYLLQWETSSTLTMLGKPPVHCCGAEGLKLVWVPSRHWKQVYITVSFQQLQKRDIFVCFPKESNPDCRSSGFMSPSCLVLSGQLKPPRCTDPGGQPPFSGPCLTRATSLWPWTEGGLHATQCFKIKRLFFLETHAMAIRL